MRFMSKVALVLLLLFAIGLLGAGCGTRGIDLSQSSSQLDFGVQMAKTNLWREALFRFERAVTLDPDNAMALNNLAVAYEGIGEFEKARDAYSRALRLDRSNQHIQKNYSRFVEFYSRNRKREEALASVADRVADAAEAEQTGEPEETGEPEDPGPIEASQPEEPPKPGPVPTSDLPPDPAPPIPAVPPPGGAA